MMSKVKYTNEEFIAAVNASKSYANVIRLLGLIPAGGNYITVKSKIKELNLDVSHFTGQGWNIALKFRPFKVMPLSEILVKDSTYQSYKLAKRLLKEGLKEHRCENCNRTEWEGFPIALELHHINGDHSDNRIENLQMLCPNCHAMTDNYRGKNRKGNEHSELETAE